MARHEEAGGRSPWRNWPVLLGLIFALGLVALGWVIRPRPFLGGPLPSPNGYDDLVAAGKLVTGNVPGGNDLDKADTEALRALVEDNGEALARARVGLGRPSVVPLSTTSSLEVHFKDANLLRTVGRLLACEAALAEREGRTAEAAGLYWSLIRFGRAISFGGLILDRQVEPAVQYAGVEGLNRLARTLPADDARRLARNVEQLDRDREPLTGVFDRDLAFHLAQGGVQLRLAYVVQRKAMQGLLTPAKRAAEEGDRQGQARLRLIALTLAMQAYRLDHPDAPVPPTLEALAPAYLKTLPADPFAANRPLTFKPQDKDKPAQVYSVGPDGRDDGGTRPSSRNSAGGDLLLDLP